MSRQQKHAWFNLAVFGGASLVFAVLVLLTGNPKCSLGAFGILGLWGLGVFFYRKKPGSFSVAMDEREELIGRGSLLLGYSVFWVSFVAACMVPWAIFFYRGQKSVTVPIEFLVLPIVAGVTILTVTQSVATLIMCGRTGKDAAE